MVNNPMTVYFFCAIWSLYHHCHRNDVTIAVQYSKNVWLNQLRKISK